MPTRLLRGLTGALFGTGGGWVAYAARRLLLTVPLLVAVSFLVFAVVNAFPGDPCRLKLGQHVSEHALAACHRDLGLDQPFLTRYADFLAGAVRLDFGRDLFTNEDVSREIAWRLAATLELSLAALLLATFLGVWLGTRSALKPGGWSDALGQLVALGGTSMPVFWLGMLLILLFAVGLGWLPSSGWTASEIGRGFTYKTGFFFGEALVRGEWAAVKSALAHLVLPAVALATIPLAVITRMTRSAMLEEIRKDYVTTARAKGLPERTVIARHVRRNALIPVVTITGLQLGTLLSGAVLTESVFSWHGMGTYMVEAAVARNHTVLMACMLLFTAIFVVVNLLVDLLYHAIDPRLRTAAPR
jgi:peptide/nickel transport system permease protein